MRPQSRFFISILFIHLLLLKSCLLFLYLYNSFYDYWLHSDELAWLQDKRVTSYLSLHNREGPVWKIQLVKLADNVLQGISQSAKALPSMPAIPIPNPLPASRQVITTADI